MTEKTELQCDGCGATFRGFLEEMAEKNEKVLCPKCRVTCPPLGEEGEPHKSVQ